MTESALRSQGCMTCPDEVFRARKSTEKTGWSWAVPAPYGPGETGQLAAVSSASRAKFSNWPRAITRSPTESSGAVKRPRDVTTLSRSRVVEPTGTST